MPDDRTQTVIFARSAELIPDERIRCLELIDGFEIGRRYIIGPAGATIGRTPPGEIILPDLEVSRSHCRLLSAGDDLIVSDLNSTNGTYVDDVRVVEATRIPLGSVLRVGRQLLKHEWRTAKEIQQQEKLDRELREANSYVQGLLPPPITDGRIRTDWYYEPCTRLGGDAFGYGMISSTSFAFYIMDVSGHGAGAAMHSATVMNLLRQRALPNTDMLQPVKVLSTLNAMFPMDSHAGMYFTMWYGVYDLTTRRLEFASAGHHPAVLVPPDKSAAIPMRTAGGLIGADPDTKYQFGTVEIPENALVYLFSDGVFEIVTVGGLEWRLKDFMPHLLHSPVAGVGEAQRLYREVRNVARPGLDDDFSLLVAQFG